MNTRTIAARLAGFVLLCASTAEAPSYLPDGPQAGEPRVICRYRFHQAGRASNPRARSHQAATRSNPASSSMRPTS